MKPLLALVDFQKAFLVTPGLEPPMGAIVDRAASLLRSCRELHIPVAHVRTATPLGVDNLLPRLKEGSGWKPQIDSPEYQAPLPLAEKPDEWLIHKSGYSGLSEGKISSLVHQLKVDTLIVAGVYLHTCIRHTVLHAREAGWQVWVAEDAVASDEPLHAAITRRYLEARSVRFTPVATLLEMIAGTAQAAEFKLPLTAVDAAIACAARFAPEWRTGKRTARIDLVRSLSDRLASVGTILSERITDELGKPIQFSKLEIQRTVEMLAAVTERVVSEQETEEAAGAALRRRPHGTIAVITPLNNPIYLPLGKIVPAMLHGNTVVWKPAPETSGVSRDLMQLLRESDWPADLVSLLEGDRCVGRALLHDLRIDAISITGSSAAGFSAQAASAQRRIPLQAELGGNNASIVWHDADLDDAAHRIAAGAFDMSGQRCTANRRVIVHQRIRELFLELLVAATRALPCGIPNDPATRIGPLVSANRRRMVADMVRRAKADVGPCFLPHGECFSADPRAADRWYPPTILCCDDPQHEIVQEETFGPVLVVQTAGDWRQAIDLCNGVRQGLAAAIFTRSPELVQLFLDEACAGILKINQSTADAAVDVPFGGWKASGLGPPEHGMFDIEFFTRPQTIYGHTFSLR